MVVRCLGFEPPLLCSAGRRPTVRSFSSSSRLLLTLFCPFSPLLPLSLILPPHSLVPSSTPEVSLGRHPPGQYHRSAGIAELLKFKLPNFSPLRTRRDNHMPACIGDNGEPAQCANGPGVSWCRYKRYRLRLVNSTSASKSLAASTRPCICLSPCCACWTHKPQIGADCAVIRPCCSDSSQP